MELLAKITGSIVEQAFAPIKRHIGYLVSYKSNIKKLEKEFKKLDVRRKDIQRMVDKESCKGLEVSIEVQTWLDDTNKIEAEVARITTDDASMNCFLNINLGYKLGKKAAKHIKTIDELQKRQFDILAHERPPPSTTDSLLFNEDYLIFDSRKSSQGEILEALKDKAVYLIGLCGMGGVGKTTLVKQVAKEAKEQSLFGEVVMVTVSQNRDLKRIQTVMAESLGFHLNEESVEVRAAKLRQRLTTTENKVLVILDDLWDVLVLSQVGVQLLPQMGTTCKVVITTRNKDVCERMSCQKIVELKILSDEESLNLFRRRAGDTKESSTALELARECAGLPLALVVFGAALRGKTPKIWNTVLTQLKRSMELDLQGVSTQVFQPIKLSFDFLETKAAKSCFLYCCLYPEDFEIPKEELMHMMVGGSLLVGVQTLHEAENRVELILDQLKARGLLLQGSSEGHVRMHDVVRDVAIQISAKYHGFYVKAGQGLTEWPENIASEMPNCQKLSLMDNDIQDLPPDPMEYPKLDTLILRGNKMLSSIPEMFFEGMEFLKVLDLSSTGIESLPKSLSSLTNLKVLNLRNCGSLEYVSHINGLKKLEILILDGAPVSVVPEGVEWAKNLRFVNLGFSESHSSCLDLYFCKVLPSCRGLEQLSMSKYVGSFRELVSLRHLTHIFIFQVVDSDNSLSREIPTQDSCPGQLSKFDICFLELDICFLERRLSYLAFSSERRVLQLRGTGNLAAWVKRLLANNTVSLLLAEFPQYELISTKSEIPLLVWSRLEHLQVVKWPNLRTLWSCTSPEQQLGEPILGLPQLKYMSIDDCPCLTRLIRFMNVPVWEPPVQHVEECIVIWEQFIPELEELRVTNCPKMYILFPDFDHINRSREPSLKILELYGLPKLWNVLPPWLCLPNLKDLIIHHCGVRRPLCTSRATVKDPLPKLENLRIENCPWLIEVVEAPPAYLQCQCCFQGLRHLTIESCNNLTHLFSYKQAISMQHLSRLYIRECAVLKAVVISTGNEEEASTSTSTHVVAAAHESYNMRIFPKLRELTLFSLPRLTAFHHPAALTIYWLNLQCSCIEKCPNLKDPLFGPGTLPQNQLGFPRLQDIRGKRIREES